MVVGDSDGVCSGAEVGLGAYVCMYRYWKFVIIFLTVFTTELMVNKQREC